MFVNTKKSLLPVADVPFPASLVIDTTYQILVNPDLDIPVPVDSF